MVDGRFRERFMSVRHVAGFVVELIHGRVRALCVELMAR